MKSIPFSRWFLPGFLFVSVTAAPLWAQGPKTAAPVSRIAGSIEEANLIALPGNVHPLAQARFDRGVAPQSMATGRITLVLQRSATQQQALTQYLADLQNPSSPFFHKWITPAQYGAAYGISDPDLQIVEAWLQSRGFKIEKVPQGRNLLQFSGTLGQIETAFHTSIHTFQVAGATHYANVSDPQIPAALTAVVAGIAPLNDFHPAAPLALGPRGHFDTSSGRIIPDLTLQTQGGGFLIFVDPADAATIYDTPNTSLNANYTSGTTYDGTGVTIGVAGVSNIPLGDIENYRTAFLGETTTNANLPTVIIDGNDPGLPGGGWEDEAILDNEVSGALAPKAKIDFYTSADTDLSSGFLNAVYRAVDDNAVGILSMSIAECERDMGTSGNAAVLEVEQQAAAQGITVVVASSDSGSAGCDNFDTATQAQYGFAVNGFASTPYNVAVGGTDFDTLATQFSAYVNDTTSGSTPYYGTALKYIPENPWNDSTTINTTYTSNVRAYNSQNEGNIVAGSGGLSQVYAKPSFQSSLTPGDSARDVPDIALLAANGFYNAAWVFCSDNVADGVTTETYTECQNNNGIFSSSTLFSGIGGTSAAAPAFAGILALVVQAQGGRLGQADYVLYQLAQSKYSTVFHDVTAGNNSVPCASGSLNCGTNGFLNGYNAGTGYDLASGLGSVDVKQLIQNWSSVSLHSTSTSLTIDGSTAAYTGTHGQPLTFNVGVTPAPSGNTEVVGIIDTANETSGGTTSGPQSNGQFSIPLTTGSGTASYNGLPGGTYTVSAQYGGDTSNASSTSTPISVTISPETSTTTLTINAYNPSTGKSISSVNIPYGYDVFADAAITGTANGSSTQGVATGTVQFLNGGTALGASPVSSGNQASWPPLNSSLAALPAGSYDLTAQYSGDASYSPSSATASFTVVKASTTTTAGYAQTTIQYGNAEQIAADALTTSYGVAPTGSFQFYVDGQPILAPQPVYESGPYNNANGNNNWAWADAQTTYAFLSLGQHTLSAAYSGDANYAGSTSTTTSATVTQANAEVAEWGFENTQQNPAYVGQSVTGTANVFGSQYGVSPTGTITFYDGNVALTDPVTYTSAHNPGALSSLQATTQHIFSAAGAHQITVSYSGDSNYTSATSPSAQSLNVLGQISVAPAGTMTISSPGQSGSVSITVTPNNGFTGAVTLSCTPPSPAQETTCGFGSGSTIASTIQLTIAGSAVSSNFTVETTAPHQSAALSGWRSRGLLLAVMFVVIAPSRRWRRRFSLMILSMGLVFSQSGCGGGGGGSGGGGGGGTTDPGTPAGTYSFTVTATSGSGTSASSTSAQVTVMVQ